MNILLVDDDLDLLDVTSYALWREGFTVTMATDGLQGLKHWQDNKPDLIILEIDLPRLSGLEVLRRIRQQGNTPVIILTRLRDDDHAVQGFQFGADDYVTKPFSARQLAMRIWAVSRRHARTNQTRVAQRVLQVGDVRLDLEEHTVHLGDRVIRLTPIQFRIFFLLASNPGRVVTATRLVEYAWSYDGGDPSLLKSHISHIRHKLRLPNAAVGDIVALPSVGYLLKRDESPDSARTSGPRRTWKRSAG